MQKRKPINYRRRLLPSFPEAYRVPLCPKTKNSSSASTDLPDCNVIFKWLRKVRVKTTVVLQDMHPQSDGNLLSTPSTVYQPCRDVLLVATL